MPASMPTASRPDSAQCDPVSRPMDSVQWATDSPSTPTPTAPTPAARRRACLSALPAPRGLLDVWGLRAGRRGVPLTDSGRGTTLRPDMGHLLTRGLVFRAGRVLLARGRLAVRTANGLLPVRGASTGGSPGTSFPAVPPSFPACWRPVSPGFFRCFRPDPAETEP